MIFCGYIGFAMCHSFQISIFSEVKLGLVSVCIFVICEYRMTLSKFFNETTNKQY